MSLHYIQTSWTRKTYYLHFHDKYSFDLQHRHHIHTMKNQHASFKYPQEHKILQHLLSKMAILSITIPMITIIRKNTIKLNKPRMPLPWCQGHHCPSTPCLPASYCPIASFAAWVGFSSPVALIICQLRILRCNLLIHDFHWPMQFSHL